MTGVVLRIANAPCSWGVIEGIDGSRAGWIRVVDEMSAAGYVGTELGDWGFMPTDPDVLQAANLAGARRILICIPESFDAGQIVAQARQARPGLTVFARAHSDAEVDHLTRHGADLVIMGEREIARRMVAALSEAGAAAASQ